MAYQVLVEVAPPGFAERPRPQQAIPLKDDPRGRWRLRVGDYRVLYLIDDRRQLVVVTDIVHREKDTYDAR